MPIQSRQEIYEHIAAALIASYNQLQATQLERGLVGTTAETILTDWIKQWLPARITIESGAVISVHDDPTDQMDCLLFDHIECPVFQRRGRTAILPIEGVSGAIEINSGANTPYDKLIADAEKLEKLGRLWTHRLRKLAVPLSHLPFNSDPTTATPEQMTDGLILHQGHYLKPLLLIFAKQLRGSLQEAATRLMSHNKRAGITFSVDGLFVLKEGFALHVDPNRRGWTSQRIQGEDFGCLSMSDRHVLIHLQNVILKHLYLSGKSHPAGFDAYTAATSQGEREISSATIVSDQEYVAQSDQALGMRA